MNQGLIASLDVGSMSYYVDKTELIYELVNDTDNKVTLFTRPRHFGKRS